MKKATHSDRNPQTARVIFPYKGGWHSFRPEQIIRLQSESNYTYIHVADHKPILMAKVLSAYESLLAPYGFVRTHRSHLVNRHHIVNITGDSTIVMADDSTAEISRRKRKIVFHEVQSASDAA